ncbi:MAG: homoserine dehydrogenase [Lachnospiraceae bacterium]|nr:homoserine dehydrogenase [Lachnospiraceae bacterium]
MKAAIMGYGTIGSGVAEVLRVNRDVIAKRVGEPIDVKYILDLREFPGDPEAGKFVNDVNVIVNDPEVKLVVETMGGVHPAYEFVRANLEAGKSVTTSNKALVADMGAELIKVARENQVNFMFEASVGGGIPIIRILQTCLTGDVVEEITGIVNGTTNYMMTEMTENGSDFDDVLKDAQSKGFAEKDPTADIEGYDASRKIAILTSIVAGQTVDYQDIPTEGITHIDSQDIRYASKMGRKIKLLARMVKTGDTYCCRVAPYLLPSEHPLYPVDGVFNAVFVKGNMLGDSMYYGSGAGKLPTASAVVGDVVAMAKHEKRHIFVDWKDEKLELSDPSEQTNRYFVRANKGPGDVVHIFPDAKIIPAGVDNETGFVTPLLSEKEMKEKAELLGKVFKIIRFA